MLLALALAPSTMVAASAAERRWGPAAAGRVGALPVTLAPALLALGSSAGTVASAAASHVPAQVALAIAFVAVLPHGVRAAIAAGVAAYVGVAIATPEAVGLALAVPALAVGARVLAGEGRASGDEAQSPGGGVAVVRAGVAAALGVTVVGAERLGGPELAGVVAGFPALSLTLALLIHRARGAGAAAQTLGGLVRGLAGYFAFAATAALLAPSPLAVPAGLAACAVTAGGRYHRRAIQNGQRRPHRHR